MAKTAKGPQTLATQGLVNQIVRGLLHAPGLSKVVGSRLLTVYVTGRKSGQESADRPTYHSP